MYPPNSDGAVVPLDAEGGAGGEQHVGAGVGRVPHLPTCHTV